MNWLELLVVNFLTWLLYRRHLTLTWHLAWHRSHNHSRGAVNGRVSNTTTCYSLSCLQQQAPYFSISRRRLCNYSACLFPMCTFLLSCLCRVKIIYTGAVSPSCLVLHFNISCFCSTIRFLFQPRNIHCVCLKDWCLPSCLSVQDLAMNLN